MTDGENVFYRSKPLTPPAREPRPAEPLSKGPNDGAKPTEGEPEPESADATPWGDAEGEIVAGLGRGDFEAYLARAKSDDGFPFEREASAASEKLRRSSPADWQRLPGAAEDGNKNPSFGARSRNEGPRPQ